MTCAELRLRLDAYAAGLLPAEETGAFEDHLATCEVCAALLEQAEPRPDEAPALPRSVEPGADLWPAIQARLALRGRRRVSLPGWLLAAAAVGLIVVSSGVTALVLKRPPVPPSLAEGSAISPLEAQYAAAAADLGAALDRTRSRLNPETITTIERNLAVIDNALAESRRALANDPGNAALEQLVIATWQRKMDFMRRAMALSASS